MKTNINVAIEIAYLIKEKLNNEILNNGEIKINNKELWHGYLHQLDNAAWSGMIDLYLELYKQQPRLFKLNHLNALTRARELLDKYSDYYDNVLDMRNKKMSNKGTAWACIMTIREVWNEAVGVYLPNDNSSKEKTTFNNVFEIN